MQQSTAQVLMSYAIEISVISVASGNNRVAIGRGLRGIGLGLAKPDLLPVISSDGLGASNNNPFYYDFLSC